MNIIRILLILAVASGIFLPMFFNPPQLTREPLLTPVWMRDFRPDSRESEDGFRMAGSGSGDEPGLEAELNWVPLFQDGNLLYVSARGDAGSYEDASFYLDYNSHRYFNTGQYHNTLVARTPRGGIDEVLQSNWFPVLSSQGLLLVSPDGFGLKRLDEQLRELFTREWASLIVTADTAQDQDETYTVVGLLDGRIVILNNNGEELYSRGLRDNSRYPVIYNVQIMAGSPEGLELVVLAGHTPLHLYRISLAKDQDGGLYAVDPVRRELPFQITSPAPLFVRRGIEETFFVSHDNRTFSLSYNPESGTLSEAVARDTPGALTEFWQDYPSTPERRLEGNRAGTELYVYRGDTSTSLELYGGEGYLWFKSARSIPYAINYLDSMFFQRIDSRVFAYVLEEG
ncbi:hypothetical protein [Salinispira pacifica]|uniref:Uncharacterized protein n=1 Tax=Salinispira pacifica TaxID=1307761 RepID=V5WFH7_9SPIO|nr:hypothetical protein [Salinispira pacifica]AHC14552.1 hypothetical protein L21SP2_1149 [Salinispira pacifica]